MIHDEHPFTDPEEARDPVRRFRGRLAAPVTVVTSGRGEERTGLTVSSLVVVEGEVPAVFFLLQPITDLWTRIVETGGFVVHVLERRHRGLADRFAGYRPSPGGLFAGLEVSDGPRGPVLDGVATRAACRYVWHRDAGHLLLVQGAMESVDLHDLTDPLQYFRGRYLLHRAEPDPGDPE